MKSAFRGLESTSSHIQTKCQRKKIRIGSMTLIPMTTVSKTGDAWSYFEPSSWGPVMVWPKPLSETIFNSKKHLFTV